jgi:hypothetical protein
MEGTAVNTWETFFAWWPVRIGRRTYWLRRMQRTRAYFQALTDDNTIQPPTWVYRLPRK